MSRWRGIKGADSLIRLVEQHAGVVFVGTTTGGAHRQLIFKRPIDGASARFPVACDMTQMRTRLNYAKQIKRWASGQMDGHGGRWSLPY
jgi:hypothetical protein